MISDNAIVKPKESLPIRISLPSGFLCSEVRDGYLISEEMKAVWAVQLDLLSVFQRLCDKHGLSYFADSGTLLGAVRHKGYIPWDDDIDLVMPRKDYDKLVALGNEELDEPYFLQTSYSDCFIRPFARIRNSNTTALIKNEIRSHCNKGIFIDIFPIDSVPNGFSRNHRRVRRISLATTLIRIGVESKPDYYQAYTQKAFCVMCNALFSIVNYKSYMRHIESMIRKLAPPVTDNISNVALSMGNQKSIWPRGAYSDFKTVPFEFLSIRIPIGFDDRLSIEYGQDYMTPVKSKTAHGHCLFSVSIPFEAYLAEHTEEDILRLIE